MSVASGSSSSVGLLHSSLRRLLIPQQLLCQRHLRRPLHSSSSRTASISPSNHYDTLDLPRTATKQQIKAQFYKLSKEYHPDSKPGHETKFQAISEAYATLGNANARRSYDASMTARPMSGSSSYAGTTHGYQEPEVGSDRRARANYAWENTRRTHPRYARQNPFAQASSTAYSSAYSSESSNASNDPFHHYEHYDRMQARQAWRAANMSSGQRKRMEQEAQASAKEEDLRNTSGTARAIQVVAIFVVVIWMTGGMRASAMEKSQKEMGQEVDLVDCLD